MEHYGKVNVVEMGSKPGEKLDEMLISKHEALQSYCYDDSYYVILPTNASVELLDHYNLLPKFQHAEFSSRTKLMNRDEIKQMLIKGKFL